MGKKDITLNEFLGDPHIFACLLYTSDAADE